MKQQITALMDTILTKGMAIVESEKCQQLLSSPQAQKAMDLGISALTKVNEIKEAAKSKIAANLGLATQKDLDALRESLNKVEEKVGVSDDAAAIAADNNNDAE